MRVKVVGDNATANGLRGILTSQQFVLVELFPQILVEIKEGAARPEMDSVDGPFERGLLNNWTELSPSGQVLVLRSAGSNSDDRVVVVDVPANETESWAFQRACLRTLEQLRGKPSWWRLW